MRLLIISRDCFLTDALKLCQYAAERHEVTLVTSQAPERALPELRDVCIRSAHLTGGPVRRLFQWLRHCRSVARAEYDCLYLHYFPACSLLRLHAASSPAILDIRTAAVLSGRLNRGVRDRLLRLEASRFPMLAVISEGVRDRLHLSHRECCIVPVGGDCLDAPSREFNTLRLLYVGSVNKSRRLEDTIEAVARFRRQPVDGLDVRYTIVGDSRDGNLELLRRLVAGMGLANVIDLPGYVPHDQLVPYFEGANVGVSYVPITDYFDYQPPTKTFEYLLAGMPVLATATSANRKVITPRSGVLVRDTPEDCYRGLCEIAAARQSYRSGEIQRSAAAYSWRRIMQGLVLPLIEGSASTPVNPVTGPLYSAGH